jgi:hypothetical protein
MNGKNEIAEVQFYFRARLANKDYALALVSLFSEPEGPLFESSSGTVISCRYQGQDAYRVVEVTSILSVVSMVPIQRDGAQRYFLAEKLGLDMAYLAGISEDSNGGDNVEE